MNDEYEMIDDSYQKRLLQSEQEYLRKQERHPETIVKIDLQKLVKNIFSI